MEILKYIFCGGTRLGRLIPDDPHERRGPPTHFKKHAGLFILAALFIYSISPLLFISSEFGFIPFENSEFAKLEVAEQYFRVLSYNIIIFLKTVTSIDPSFVPALPAPVGEGWHFLVSVTLLLVLASSFALFGIGINRIIRNIKSL